MIEVIEEPSVRHQCEILNISRGAYYYEPCPETEENLALMLLMDRWHMENPTYGSRRLQVLLELNGNIVNRKRVIRLMQVMGMQAIYPRRHLSQPGEDHQIYPYLLNNLAITGPNQVWCCDITYIPMQYGFMYLVAVMDWWSRYVLAWELSNTMEAEFCIRAWEQALAHAGCAPLISNTDQGSQFTSPGYIDAVESAGTSVSMDGRGRWIDNRFIERLWRSVKYEDVYLNDYGDGLSAGRGLGSWFGKYNHERPHQSLEYAMPVDWYRTWQNYGGLPATWEAMRLPEKTSTKNLSEIKSSQMWNDSEDF